jgi:hypothetical protein
LCTHITNNESWAKELRNPDVADLKVSDSKILSFLRGHLDKPAAHSLSDFKSWLTLSKDSISDAAREAMHIASDLRHARWKRKRELAKTLLINTHSDCVQIAIEKLKKLIPVYRVKKLVDPYPPPKHWIVENQAIWDLWVSHISTGKQPDRRIKRKAMHMVDIEKLAHDLPPEESAMFLDEDGKLVLMVISDFCKSEEVLQWANEIVLLNVALETNVRVRISFLQHAIAKQQCFAEGRCRIHCHSRLVCWFTLANAPRPCEKLRTEEQFVETAEN